MTPNEMSILKSLVVVAWADGEVAHPEAAVIEGLLAAFDASHEEEREVLDFARQRRTLVEDIPLAKLGAEDRELLLANAALLTHADGKQTPSEKLILNKLVKLLGFSFEQAAPIVLSARDGHLQLGAKVLEDLGPDGEPIERPRLDEISEILDLTELRESAPAAPPPAPSRKAAAAAQAAADDAAAVTAAAGAAASAAIRDVTAPAAPDGDADPKTPAD